MQNRNNEKLKRDLYDLLIQDNISMDTSIITEIIYEMAGVEFKKGNSGFVFHSDDKNKLSFNLPTLKWPEVKKFLSLFNIPEDEYESNSSLTLDLNYVFDTIFQNAKAYYQNLVEKDSDIIKKYKIESKSILENTAIRSMNKYIQAALDVIMPKKASPIPADLKPLIRDLHALKSEIASLDKHPTLYEMVIEFSSEILKHIQSSAVSERKELAQKLNLVLDSIELFKIHHRTEAVLKNLAFKKEMKELLKPYKISTALCDIVEEGLLSLADVKLGSNGKCKFREGYGDTSRLVFELKDITKDNTKKLIQYLRDQGDETALEGYGYSRGGSYIPESYNESACFSVSSLKSMHSSTPKIRVEEHSIETDGKFFYDKMMEKLKTEIVSKLKSDPELLKKYQDKSAQYFEAKEAKAISSGKMSMFQPKTIVSTSNVMDIEDDKGFSMQLK